MTRTASPSDSVSCAYSRTTSRSASAAHRPRPRIACWRHGPESPAASARIQPVFRGSLPRSPSRNFSADAATRSWLNNGRIRAFTSRNDDAQSSSVVSTDAPAIHDLPNHGGPSIQKFEQNATVMLGASVLGAGATCQTRIDWLTTFRLRAGYAWSHFLFYTTAGGAAGDFRLSSSPSGANHNPTPPLGWTAGLGVEYLFSDAISAKLEYLYVNLGTVG